AVYPDARNPFAFPELRDREGLDPWTVREVWISGSPSPTHFVDVTATFGRKIAALRAHESQTGHMGDLEERLRGWLSRAAALGGLPEGRLAESFQVLETVLARGRRTAAKPPSRGPRGDQGGLAGASGALRSRDIAAGTSAGSGGSGGSSPRTSTTSGLGEDVAEDLYGVARGLGLQAELLHDLEVAVHL
ncbi:MAG TPA: hypothetical protein VEH31_37135, partial [Streptosporangiaceae bacterium]|nr:hypothetical protein [Streptosporangiaceae bacterium]